MSEVSAGRYVHILALVAVSTSVLVSRAQIPRNDGGGRSASAEGFYTAVQSQRGRAWFRTSCASCHSADAAETTRPGPRSARTSLMPLGGSKLRKWVSAR